MPINKDIVIVISVIVACVAISGYWIIHKRIIMNQAAKIVSEVYAVWAAQGPFENGETSAQAMRYAYIVVRGMDSLDDEGTKNAISLHGNSFNNEPERWETLRQDSLSIATGEKFEEQFRTAINMASNDKAIMEFGEKLLSDGSTESKKLISLLNEIHKSRHGVEIENCMTLGFTYTKVLAESLSSPEDEIYQLFNKLKEDWQKVKEKGD